MKIYTKTGDDGETSLIKQGRIKKSDNTFEVLGDLDELNAIMGFLQSVRSKEVRLIILDVQSRLLSMGAQIAGAEVMQDWQVNVSRLEQKIDELDAMNLELKNFILPGGSMHSSYLHLARAVCRRVERSMIRLNCSQEQVVYINRLSDMLFVLARYVNKNLGVSEVIWKA